MALINCSECGKEISDKAAFCPHCGITRNSIPAVSYKSNSAMKFLSICFIIMAVICGISATIYGVKLLDLSNSSYLSADNLIKKNSMEISAVYSLIGLVVFVICNTFCQKVIKANNVNNQLLKNVFPDTTKE